MKFTPEGGRVSVGLEQENGAAVIEVADTGIGITFRVQLPAEL